MKHEDLLEGYLRYLEAAEAQPSKSLDSDILPGAVAVDELVERDPDEGWRITCALVNRAPSDRALAIVAAGPLEDLLTKHGVAVIDRVEEESRKNDRLRLALSGVWGIGPGNPIYQRWYALMWKYGFAEGKRVPL